MKQSQALTIIAKTISNCVRCAELAEYRTDYEYQTVPGEGHPNADLMIVGEAPGEDEALSGRPFVGRAGKLLDKIILQAGWKRENIFIANILKCRPPGNRVPGSQEAANCLPYLNSQIKVINPQWLLCLGKTAAIHLLGKDPKRSMMSLRGEHVYQSRKVICTYHPSYLLRTPSAMNDVWKDIQPIIKSLQAPKTSQEAT